MKNLVGLVLAVGTILSLATVSYAKEHDYTNTFQASSVEIASKKIDTPNCERHNWVYDHTVYKDVEFNGNVVIEQYDWYVCSVCGREMYKRVK